MPISPSLTNQQQQDSLNYLLSGPGSLGQNFSGFSDYNQSWLSGNQRPPYSQLDYAYPATGLVGSNQILVNDIDGLVVGLLANSNYGIPSGTTITNVGQLINGQAIITLSNNLTLNLDTLVQFKHVTHPYTYTQSITLSTSEMLDEYTYKFTFAVPWTSSDGTTRVVPFTLGQGIIVSGVINTNYNKQYNPIGVVKCTTTYVIAKMETPITMQSPSTSGTVSFTITTMPSDPNPGKLNYIHTDCNAIATVYSATDKVFINGQVDHRFSYTSTTVSNIQYFVVINRYKSIQSVIGNTLTYQFIYDKTITGKGFVANSLPIGTNLNYPVTDYTPIVFSSVIDTPPIGLYSYIIDVAYITTSGDLVVTKSDSTLRSLTTQVVKQ
jgi:hypothetical protein